MDECPKELESQHHASPGVVEDDEVIIYVLIDPDLYENGSLKKSAFSKSTLKKKELSVCRGHHSAAAEAKEKIFEPQAIKQPERKLIGAYNTVCSSIRGLLICDTESRAICVIDDASDDFVGHAHLGFSDAFFNEELNLRNHFVATRSNLVRIFEQNGLKSLEECF